MKYFFLSFITFFLVQRISGQDLGIPYQAIALDSLGKTMKNQAVQVRIGIFDSCATCTLLYQEVHSKQTDNSGLFSLIIGKGIPTNPTNFSLIPWSNTKNKWITIDLWRNQSFQTIGTQQLFYAPFSIYSKKAEEVNKLPRSTQNYIFTDGW